MAHRQTLCDEECRRAWTNARKRRHAAARRAKCADCGATLAEGSGYPGAKEKRCPDCWKDFAAEQHRERDEQIVEWWAEGLTLKEIRTRLGWSRGHIAQEFHRMRARGCDLPYRRARGIRNATKFPHLQKAA